MLRAKWWLAPRNRTSRSMCRWKDSTTWHKHGLRKGVQTWGFQSFKTYVTETQRTGLLWGPRTSHANVHSGTQTCFGGRLISSDELVSTTLPATVLFTFLPSTQTTLQLKIPSLCLSVTSTCHLFEMWGLGTNPLVSKVS